MGRRHIAALAALLVAAPVAAQAQDRAPVPEGYEPPLTTVTVRTVWEAPLTTVTKFYTNPQKVETEALEEAVGAKQESGDTVVELSDRFLFDFNSAELRPTASSQLDTMVAILEEGEGDVEIIGHTDSMGTDEINQPLSEERAQAVADYLEEKGIEAGRLKASGKGSSDPVADNTTADGRDNPEGRQQNRRVEIRYAG